MRIRALGWALAWALTGCSTERLPPGLGIDGSAGIDLASDAERFRALWANEVLPPVACAAELGGLLGDATVNKKLYDVLQGVWLACPRADEVESRRLWHAPGGVGLWFGEHRRWAILRVEGGLLVRGEGADWQGTWSKNDCMFEIDGANGEAWAGAVQVFQNPSRLRFVPGATTVAGFSDHDFVPPAP